MYNNNNGYNNGYQQNNYGQQPQQQSNEQYWPKVSGFKIGPSKSGKGNVITFTINAAPNARAKQAAMLFNDFIKALQDAFNESGGNGVRLVIPFHQGTGPRGPFQSGSIKVMANNPAQYQQGFNGGGGGRRQYPPQQQQQGYGYQQPPQPQYGHSGGYTNPPQQQQPAQQPVAPPQQQAPAPQSPAQAPAQQQVPQGYGVGEPIPF